MKHTIKTMYNEDKPDFDYNIGADFFRRVMDRLMETSYKESKTIKLPHGLGRLGVKKVKQAKYIDWKESKEKNKLCFKHNLHTGGNGFKFHWTLGKYGRNKYSSVFSFRAARYHKRNLNTYIRVLCDDPEQYDYDASNWL